MVKSTQSKASTVRSKEIVKEPKSLIPVSLPVIQRGVTNSLDARNLMIAVASDLITGALAANVGAGVCNAIGKLCKIVEMEFKYGPKSPDSPNRFLVLASSAKEDSSKTA